MAPRKESLQWLFKLPRVQKAVILSTLDVVILSASFFASLYLVTEGSRALKDPDTWLLLIASLSICIVLFTRLRLYRAIIRYSNQRLAKTILSGATITTFLMGLINLMLGTPIPASTPIIFLLLSIFCIGGSRFCIRGIFQHLKSPDRLPVIIYGAGEAGSQLATSLRNGREYFPIAFIDDWRGMKGTFVAGVKVYSPDDLKRLINDYQVQRILLAIPSAPRSRRRDIVLSLESLGVPVQTVPGMEDVVTGRASVSDVRDVAVEDLLGRDPVPEDPRLMDANIRDKVVMVTGAGGSIGSELCRQIILHKPKLLLLLDISEHSLYQIDNELEGMIKKAGERISVKPLIGSIQRRKRLDTILSCFNVDTIYHAAAYKHVPLVEHNILEGIRNNVFGTLTLAKSAIENNVETFVMVSTDKAVRPTNVMGTTKRLAEMICQALADEQRHTRFCMVRFGNVLGSSGSVVPLFRKQIDSGGPITVTHPDITRYFMTIPEAAQLVIQAAAMGKGGDLFLLDMGEPVRIAELAKEMVRLSGLEVASEEKPGGDIEIVYTGLRPGEKLYEELIIDSTSRPTAHPRIMVAQEKHWSWEQLAPFLDDLESAVSASEYSHIHQLLKDAPTAYQPKSSLADLVWAQDQEKEEALSLALAQQSEVASEPTGWACHPLSSTPST
jgi:FlaA1/EpsC-like NDP-sugar epimerase